MRTIAECKNCGCRIESCGARWNQYRKVYENWWHDNEAKHFEWKENKKSDNVCVAKHNCFCEIPEPKKGTIMMLMNQ